MNNNKSEVVCSSDKAYQISRVNPTCVSSGGSSVWTNNDITLTGVCTAYGEVGCAGNATKVYSSNLESTTESPGEVCDNAGNCITCPSDQTVKIDKDNPVISATNNSSDWFNYQRAANVNGVDVLSDVEQIRYSFDSNQMNVECTSGGTTTTNGSSLNAPIGGTTLYLCARDNAGNVNTWSGVYNWENTSPTAPSLSPTSQSWTNSNITVSFSSTDTGGSSLDYYQYCSTTDGSTCTPTIEGSNITLSGVGEYRVCARAIDVVGNVGLTSCSEVGDYVIELNYIWSELMQGYYYDDGLNEYDSFHYYLPKP